MRRSLPRFAVTLAAGVLLLGAPARRRPTWEPYVLSLHAASSATATAALTDLSAYGITVTGTANATWESANLFEVMVDRGTMQIKVADPRAKPSAAMDYPSGGAWVPFLKARGGRPVGPQSIQCGRDRNHRARDGVAGLSWTEEPPGPLLGGQRECRARGEPHLQVVHVRHSRRGKPVPADGSRAPQDACGPASRAGPERQEAGRVWWMPVTHGADRRHHPGRFAHGIAAATVQMTAG